MSSLAPFDIDVGPESEELKKIAQEQLRETPEIRDEATKQLRQLLHDNEDLFFRDDDEFLQIFLRPCHWYPESAIKLMRRIAEFKKEHAKVLDQLSPDNDKAAFTETPTLNILTNKDQKGRRVLIVQCGALWDPKKVDTDQLFRLFYLVQLIAMLEPSTQINGVVVIMDYQGLAMKQVMALSPSFAKLLLKFLQYAMPLRLKEVHFVNQPKMLFALIWKIFQPLIEQKLRSRIFFHATDMSSLHKYMDPAVLPKNYGGDLPEINYGGKEWYSCVDNYRDHMSKWNTYGFAGKK